MIDIEREEFENLMKSEFPKIFSERYGGFCIGPGWYQIVESLCRQIQAYIDHVEDVRERLLKNNPYNHEIPELVKQVVAVQIKEKFGGLRFYYEGGDARIYGMVRMAESWAAHSCEECGDRGERTNGGWIRTLCEKHRKEDEETRRD